MKKRQTFINFSHGELNDGLCEKLHESLLTFSNYDLKIYRPSDFDRNYDINNPNFWKSGLGYVYKILSCIESLKKYDEVVWLDTDIIATNYIDKIWFESFRIESYPLLPQQRFNNIKGESLGNDVWKSIPLLKNGTTRQFYSQACCMLFNKNCVDFFNETLSYFNEFDSPKYPYGDESIINYLLWDKDLTNNLGDIFLCSHFFHINLGMYISSINRENFKFSHNYTYKNNNFENILFLHGCKNLDVVDNLLTEMKKYRK
jgi:lipopolysaccharide biosynthesis glycosyltransferase